MLPVGRDRLVGERIKSGERANENLLYNGIVANGRDRVVERGRETAEEITGGS